MARSGRGRRRDREGPVRVLLSLRPPSGTTRFVDQLVAGLEPDVEVAYFSYPRALAGGYDVFHVHWPEYLFRAPRRRARARRTAQFLLLMTVLRLRGIPVVRTLHNLAPHTPGPRYERVLLRLVDRATTRYVRLNAATVPPTDRPVTTILHGHYTDRYRTTGASRVPGRLLFFGRIEPYKGVDVLVETVARDPQAELTLHVVGEPRSAALAGAITRSAAADPRITVRLEFVPDDVVAAELAAAELVVLPYREMHNSGVALVAVSAQVPVLTPVSDGALELRREVGEDWVLLYDGELATGLLHTTLETVRHRPPPPAPRLDGRDWAEVGRAHSALYREVVSG